ncbi:hypothetical protein ACFOMH_04605, partial [Paracoccus mangrovi]
TRHAITIVSTIDGGHYPPLSPRGRAVRPDAYEAFDFGLGRARQRTEIFVLPNINGTSGIAFYGICTGVLDAFAGNA